MCIYYDSQPYPLQFLERVNEDGEESANNMESNDEMSQEDEATSQESAEESYGKIKIKLHKSVSCANIH